MKAITIITTIIIVELVILFVFFNSTPVSKHPPRRIEKSVHKCGSITQRIDDDDTH
jgi:hypothetical protein